MLRGAQRCKATWRHASRRTPEQVHDSGRKHEVADEDIGHAIAHARFETLMIPKQHGRLRHIEPFDDSRAVQQRAPALAFVQKRARPNRANAMADSGWI